MRCKPIIIYSLLIITVFQACSKKATIQGNGNEQALLHVNGRTLYKGEVENAIPKGLSTVDSAFAAEAYIKMWIKNELVYEKAKDNLLDKEKIDELVENYRQTLTIYTYQEQLLRERLTKEISERELKEYYENNSGQFKLETNIIKGLFLKVPVNAPQLEDLKKWYKSTNEKAIENIEKYSLQNAVIYDYFYDKWVDLDEVMNNIPYPLISGSHFLRNNRNLEVQDSTYVYLLNIKEYIPVGEIAPFNYSQGQVFDILLNQKRENFIKKFEDDLYNSAIKNKQIKFYNK